MQIARKIDVERERFVRDGIDAIGAPDQQIAHAAVRFGIDRTEPGTRQQSRRTELPGVERSSRAIGRVAPAIAQRAQMQGIETRLVA